MRFLPLVVIAAMLGGYAIYQKQASTAVAAPIAATMPKPADTAAGIPDEKSTPVEKTDAAPQAAPDAATAAATPPAAPAEPAKPHGSSSDVKALLSVQKNDVVIGKPGAPVTIVEYMSLSCPHCKFFHDTIQPTLDKQFFAPGKVKLVIRPFPHNKPAYDAARLVACVPPKQAVKFIDVLFAMQERWAYTLDNEAALRSIAAVGGLSDADYDRCMKDRAIETRVLASRDLATKILGIDSIPTIVIGGKNIEASENAQDYIDAINAAKPDDAP